MRALEFITGNMVYTGLYLNLTDDSHLNVFFSIPANATTPFARNDSMENITQTTLSIEMIEGTVYTLGQ